MRANRTALLLANSVTAQHTQERTPAALVRRTVEQVVSTLSHLPPPYAFDCTTMVDEPGDRVRRSIDRAAEQARDRDSLLLIYYFGHGRLEEDDLALVYPGKKNDQPKTLAFKAILHQVEVHAPKKVLFVLDCCYAGAAASQIDSIAKHHCLMACTTPTTRAYFEESFGRPIGIFTRALLSGISSSSATVSITDESITAQSLFGHAQRETEDGTHGAQQPYLRGSLNEPISVWTANPSIIEGVADAPIKSGYSKLRAILKTMQRRRRFEDVKQLYEIALLHNRSEFLTPYKDKDGRISERPAHWTSIRRYVGFLRAIGALDEETLELTTTGSSLIADGDSQYNAKLLPLLDRYLNANRISRESIRQSMRDLLQRRALPTMQNIITDLSLRNGYRLNQGHVGLLLQILGYVGAVGMAKNRDQVFFPWTADDQSCLRQS